MTKNLTLFILLFLTFGLSAQVVQTQQSTLLVKKTATWCPYCGQWGWTLMKGLLDDNEDKAIVMGAHFSGNLVNDDAVELASDFGGAGQPVFYNGRENIGANSGNIAAKRTEMQNVVDANFSSTARIGVGVKVLDHQGMYEIKVRTEALEDVNGEFNVAMWVLENDVLSTQAGRSGTQMHPNVFRKAVNGVFGESLVNGTLQKGRIDDFTFGYTPDPSFDTDNLKFVVVIFRNDGGTWYFENGLLQDEVELSTSNVDLASGYDFSVQPSIVTDYGSIVVRNTLSGNAHIVVRDILGNEVMKIYSGQMEQGTRVFHFEKDNIGRAGMYLVSMEMNHKVVTKRLLIK